MAAKHKHQNATFTARTSLAPEHVVEIAKAAAETVKSSIPGQPFVRFEGGGPDVLRFSLRHLGGHATLMTFHTTVEADAAGTVATTRIDGFKTSQQTVMFIPIMPKSLVGYSHYKRFAAAFERALRAADSGVSAQLVERPA